MTDGTTVTTTDYLSGFQYKNAVLEFFPTAEGYVKQTTAGGNSNYSYVFNYTDHLGNIRVSYALDPTENVLKILEENHYYPFGLKHNGYSATQQMLSTGPVYQTPITIVPVTNPTDVVYNFNFNGKELQEELGLNMYDFGARNYDPALGRWMNIDPLASKYLSFSPYVYALNNPVYFIDLDGMQTDPPPGPGDGEKPIELPEVVINVTRNTSSGTSNFAWLECAPRCEPGACLLWERPLQELRQGVL